MALYRTHYLYDAFELHVPVHARLGPPGGGLDFGHQPPDPDIACVNMLRLGWRPHGLGDSQPDWSEFNTAWGEASLPHFSSPLSPPPSLSLFHFLGWTDRGG